MPGLLRGIARTAVIAAPRRRSVVASVVVRKNAGVRRSGFQPWFEMSRGTEIPTLYRAFTAIGGAGLETSSAT